VPIKPTNFQASNADCATERGKGDNPMSKLIESLDAFTRAYLECALWASTDNGYLGKDHPDNDPRGDATGGNPLDDNFDVEDIAEEAIAQAIKDCDNFRAYVEECGLNFGELTEERAGHDFWLNRNGHGCGYWDEGMGELGDELSDAAKTFGCCYLDVGDDGKVYMNG
jgi:hypothetical protein